MKIPALAVVMVLLATGPSPATVAVEDFNNYGSADLLDMQGLAGGSGWLSEWKAVAGSANNPGYYFDQTTSFANPAYGVANNLSGPEHGKMVCEPTDSAGNLLRRSFASGLTGTVWAGVLVRHSSNTTGDALFWLETSNSGGQADTFVGLRNGDQVNMRYGGTPVTVPGPDLNSAGLNLLYLVRIVIDADGAFDNLDFWVKKEADDLSSVAALGTPMASGSGKDLFGSELNWLAFSGGAGGYANFDALRVSDGPGAFAEVLALPGSPPPDDRDGDGLSDEQEALLGLDPNVSDAGLVAAIRAHPEYFDLYDEEGILGLTGGGVVVPRTGDSPADLFFEVQASWDMESWFPGACVRRAIPLPEGSGFLRLTIER